MDRMHHLNTVEPVRQKRLKTVTTLSPENLSFLTCFCFSLLQPFEDHCISPFSYKQLVIFKTRNIKRENSTSEDFRLVRPQLLSKWDAINQFPN